MRIGYVNVYRHRDRQFCGMAHPTREHAEHAAREELRVEKNTRLVCRLKVRGD
jgi:hypothetical protein